MPDPWSELVVPEGLDLDLIGDDVLATGRGGRGLPKPEIIAPYNAFFRPGEYVGDLVQDVNPDPGSNNWTIGGKYTTTGKPLVSNDPHREVGNPSLRYIFHLVSPGWNIIGAQEAPFVGVALGHNERVAWGLTIAGNDQTDVFVEETNPANPNEMKYNNAWEPFKIIHEEIKIKGEAPRAVEFKISRHGPILLRGRQEPSGVRDALGVPGAGNGVVPRRAAPRSGDRLQGVPGSRDVLESADREPELRRRGRQHLDPELGAHAEPPRLGRPPAGARHRQVRVGRLSAGAAAAAEPAGGLHRDGEQQHQHDRLLAARGVQDAQHRAVRSHHAHRLRVEQVLLRPEPEEVHDRGFRKAAARRVHAAGLLRSGRLQGMDWQDARNGKGAQHGRGVGRGARQGQRRGSHLRDVAAKRGRQSVRFQSSARGAAAAGGARTGEGHRQADPDAGRGLVRSGAGDACTPRRSTIHS